MACRLRRDAASYSIRCFLTTSPAQYWYASWRSPPLCSASIFRNRHTRSLRPDALDRSRVLLISYRVGALFGSKSCQGLCAALCPKKIRRLARSFPVWPGGYLSAFSTSTRLRPTDACLRRHKKLPIRLKVSQNEPFFISMTSRETGADGAQVFCPRLDRIWRPG